MIEIDWTRREITKQEAVNLLLYANECVDYVAKMLPQREAPRPVWKDLLQAQAMNLLSLRFWLQEQK